jgi:hypothetical protein
MACEVKTLVLEGLAPKTFPQRSYGKVLGEPRSEPPRNPATSGSIDHGAMHRWHHTVASLILGQLGDRFVCVKQCRYQRGEDESLSHPQTGASTATPRRSMSRRGAQPGSRPPDSRVSMSGERQAPPPPRPHGTHRSRPGSAAGRWHQVAHGVPARTKYFSSAARHR